MGIGIIERLLGAGDSIVGKVLRPIAGKNASGDATPLLVDQDGKLQISNKNVPDVVKDRLLYHTKTANIKKGQRNSIKTRLPILSKSQEFAYKPIATVTTDKLIFNFSNGTFQLNETITGGTSGATGTITRIESQFIEYTPISGTFQLNETITGNSSNANATITDMTSKNIVGQIVKIPHDNINSIALTIEGLPIIKPIDLFDADEYILQSAWSNVNNPLTKDTTYKYDGNGSIKLDASNENTYTYNINIINYTSLNGTFQINETITGGTSNATAKIIYINAPYNQLRVTQVSGVFQNGEIITGSTSGATATLTNGLITYEDWSIFDSLTLVISFNDDNDQTLELTIQDSNNNSAQKELVNKNIKQFEFHTIDIKQLASSNNIDLTAINTIKFKTTGKTKNGYTTNVDSINLIVDPGKMDIELYDMGSTLPASGTATLASGVLKKLGDLGIDGYQSNSVRININNDLHLILVDKVIHGVAKELPIETLLTPNNYYALVFKYVDTDVKIYGSEPALVGNFYTDGYSFTTPDINTPITETGANEDCMFFLGTSDEVWVSDVIISPNGTVGSNQFVVGVLDDNLRFRLLGYGSLQDNTTFNFNFRDRPIYIPQGGQLILHYLDDIMSTTTQLSIIIKYWSKNLDQYTPDP